MLFNKLSSPSPAGETKLTHYLVSGAHTESKWVGGGEGCGDGKLLILFTTLNNARDELSSPLRLLVVREIIGVRCLHDSEVLHQ